MVLEPEVIDYIEDDYTSFEREPLTNLVAAGELVAYKHEGFWQCMDTLKDKEKLEERIFSDTACWMKFNK